MSHHTMFYSGSSSSTYTQEGSGIRDDQTAEKEGASFEAAFV